MSVPIPTFTPTCPFAHTSGCPRPRPLPPSNPFTRCTETPRASPHPLPPPSPPHPSLLPSPLTPHPQVRDVPLNDTTAAIIPMPPLNPAVLLFRAVRLVCNVKQGELLGFVWLATT